MDRKKLVKELEKQLNYCNDKEEMTKIRLENIDLVRIVDDNLYVEDSIENEIKYYHNKAEYILDLINEVQNDMIYVVISRCKNRDDYTSISVSQECYTSIQEAIDFCKSKLTKEELEKHKKQIDRGLIHWYEFDNENYDYQIKVLNIK